MYYVSWSDSYSGATVAHTVDTFDEAMEGARSAWGHLCEEGYAREANGITIRDAHFIRVWPFGRSTTEIFEAEIAQAERNALAEASERAAGWDPTP
jgi:hypothetical protein